MSSSVLLLAALAACVRFVSTEGDPLPPALVELVRNSPISSIQDLQLLLAPDSVDEDADSQTAKYHQTNSTSKRVRRSIAAEQAQQAQCKVRTEVLEVTRDMLDRRNANFLLWPPCVEVQRCSGCCNSRAVQCVPTVTDTRYLQVMKIQYINKRAHYEKAIISVQDHVECRCQIAAAPRIMATKPQNTPQPHRLAPKTPTVKTPSKEELHRHDVLKQNQNPRPDDKESLWHAKQVHPHSPAVQNQMPSRAPSTERQVHTERTPLRGTQTRSDSIPHEEDRKQEEHKAHLGEQERKLPDRSGVSSTKRPLTEEQPPHTHRHRHQEAGPRHSAEHDISAHQTASVTPATAEGERRMHTNKHTHTHTHTHSIQAQSHLQHGVTSNKETVKHTHDHDHKHNPTVATEHRQHTLTHHREREDAEADGRQLGQPNEREEKQDVSLLQRKLDQEEKQQEQQRHHHSPHQPHFHLHHEVQMHTATHRPVTTAPTTTRAPPTQRNPPRHTSLRRRLRKNRRRMSKAAMRALLM